MNLSFHAAAPDLDTAELRKLAAHKLPKPAERHKVEGARANLELAWRGDQVAARLNFHAPGLQVTVSTVNATAEAAIDRVADKLERRIRDSEERRRALLRRRAEAPAVDWPTEEIFTQDEEEVLREMGALDAVLNR